MLYLQNHHIQCINLIKIKNVNTEIHWQWFVNSCSIFSVFWCQILFIVTIKDYFSTILFIRPIRAISFQITSEIQWNTSPIRACKFIPRARSLELRKLDISSMIQEIRLFWTLPMLAKFCHWINHIFCLLRSIPFFQLDNQLWFHRTKILLCCISNESNATKKGFHSGTDNTISQLHINVPKTAH